MPAPRILIVEDELPMRMALQDILEAEGYRVLTAADGAAGLEQALQREARPDPARHHDAEARRLRRVRRAAAAGDTVPPS